MSVNQIWLFIDVVYNELDFWEILTILFNFKKRSKSDSKYRKYFGQGGEWGKHCPTDINFWNDSQ